MEVVILGSGSSMGVPIVGCDCKVCASKNPRNVRTRASILLKTENNIILFDTGPDLRFQALQNDISKIDAVFYTHLHGDHINGIDEIKSFNYNVSKPIPAYGDEITISHLQNSFNYCFKPNVPDGENRGWYKPWIIPNIIKPGEQFNVGDDVFSSFVGEHGRLSVMNYVFKDFVYTTDTKNIHEDDLRSIIGIDLWVVECLRYSESESHANLEKILSWIDFVKPKRVVLTHMSHDLDYDDLLKLLPKNVQPGYDGMILQF